jgi:hypothetical protein
MPLLRLDVGRLFAGLVGASEARSREMIQLAEAMAPFLPVIRNLIQDKQSLNIIKNVFYQMKIN